MSYNYYNTQFYYKVLPLRVERSFTAYQTAAHNRLAQGARFFFGSKRAKRRRPAPSTRIAQRRLRNFLARRSHFSVSSFMSGGRCRDCTYVRLTPCLGLANRPVAAPAIFRRSRSQESNLVLIAYEATASPVGLIESCASLY